MPAFAFTIIDAGGARLRGVRDAPSLASLTDSFEREGAFVLRVVERANDAPTSRRAPWRSSADLLDVTRTLATLLTAGLPLARALDAARRLRAGPSAETVANVQALVERGERLADALAAHPAFFPANYVGLVRAGERSGNLGAAFARLTEQLEREQAIKSRLISALLYPSLLAIAGSIAVVTLLVVVLPNFAALLSDSGTELPRSTAIMVTLGEGLRRFWFIAPFALIAGAVAIVRSRQSNAGRAVLAAILDAIPIVGMLRRDTLAARFARLTGTLISGGAPVLSALQDASASISDPLTRDAATRVRNAVREGAALHRAIGAERVFPPVLSQLVALGEESARLGDLLLKAAQLFEERTERLLQRMVALVEPVMIVVFGGVVGFVALSLLQAIYSVNAGSFK